MASSFAPSVEEERSAGIRVVRMPFPNGVGGVKLSLEQIAQRIREGGKSPKVMGWAMKALLDNGIDGRSARDSAMRKMTALLNAVREATVYTADPPDAELIKSAEAMLCLAPGLCVMGGDCFPEGTLVARWLGGTYRRVPIERVEPGQKIWGWDAWTRVERVWSKGELAVDRIELESTGPWLEGPTTVLELTSDHKVFLEGLPELEQRVRVCDLRVGDALLRPTSLAPPRSDRCFDRDLKVKSIERNVRAARCWDISTADHYVYLPEHDVTVSNCDDMVVLLGSVLMSVGIPVLVVKQTFGSQDQEHVLIRAQDDQGNWVPLDPSTNLPAGQCASARQEFAVDPLNPSMIGLTGVPDAEFVGIGGVPGFGARRRRVPLHLAPRLVGRRVGAPRRLGDAVTDPTTGQVVGTDGNDLPTDSSSVLQIPEATIVGAPPVPITTGIAWAAGLGIVAGLLWEMRR